MSDRKRNRVPRPSTRSARQDERLRRRYLETTGALMEVAAAVQTGSSALIETRMGKLHAAVPQLADALAESLAAWDARCRRKRR